MSYSRFYLCDLQVHTPADAQQRYGDVGGRDPNSRFAEQLIEAHVRAGVNVIAVTDHNRVDWYPVLKAAGEKRGVTVFPGLEFSVNGCHLLAIWESDDHGYELARQFLATLFPPGTDPLDRGIPRVVTKGQVLEHARRITEEYQGLVFAPHATMKGNGVFAKGVCSNAGEVAQSEVVVAFDVCGDKAADVLSNPKSKFGAQPPRWFISGDTRSLDDVGKRAVYLKLGVPPTLEGLRQAFLAPATRVRFPATLRAEWGRVHGAQFLEGLDPKRSRLTALEITGGFHDGLKFELGPGLNAIIGGKGTGKSALIETLRYATEAGQPNDDELVRNRRQNFPANADITLGYVDGSGDEFRVHRSGGSAPAELLHDGRATGVAVGKRVHVRIFGQRELRGLADDPDQMRAFLSSFAGGEASATNDELMKLEEPLDRLNGELVTAGRSLSRVSEKSAELVDVRERLQRAQAAGADKLLAESEDLVRASRGVATILEWPKKVSDATVVLAATLPQPVAPKRASSQRDFQAAVDQLAAAVETATKSLTAEATTASSKIASLNSGWAAEHQKLQGALERRLAAAGIKEPKQYTDLKEREAELADDVAGEPALRTKLDELIDSRDKVLRRLNQLRRARSRLIEAAARDLTARVGPRVRVRVNPLGDHAPFRAAIETALKGQSIRADQIGTLASIDPSSFAIAVRKGPGAVEALGVSSSTAAKVVALTPSAVRELEQVDTPDDVIVEINLGSTSVEDWRPIQEISPGQRATALLALALAGGTEPLVVDQPEDDLDNRYIFEEVVQVLARVCETRQVIVATHNANIPILGDAEMLVAFDATSDRGRMIAAGGLEDPKVAAVAREILEGGDEAFRARQRRYLAAPTRPLVRSQK